MAQVVIDKYRAVPPVCIVTGRQKGVVFERVSLTWNGVHGGDAGTAVVLGAMSKSAQRRSETIELSLPFDEDAYETWVNARQLTTATLVLASALTVIALAVTAKLGNQVGPWALAGAAVSFVLPALCGARQTKLGPRIAGVDGTHVTLDIPSAQAARIIADHRARDEAANKLQRARRLLEKQEQKKSGERATRRVASGRH